MTRSGYAPRRAGSAIARPSALVAVRAERGTTDASPSRPGPVRLRLPQRTVSVSAWRRTLRALAAEFGCELSVTGKSHMVFRHPSGWFVFCSGSPSDRRALVNTRGLLRRAARRQDQSSAQG